MTSTVARDLQTNFNAAWRDEAAARGYASSIAIPMIDENFVWGIPKVYAVETDAFDPEEMDLLTEMARDMAQGILALSTDAECKKTEQALQISEARYRAIIEDQTDQVARFTQDGLLTSVNSLFITSCNKSWEELIGAEIFLLLDPQEQKAARSRIAALTAENPFTTLDTELPNPYGVRGIQWVYRAIADHDRAVVEYQIVGREN